MNIDIKFDDGDQVLASLCLLPMSFNNFMNSMLFGRDSISLANAKSSLNSKELKTKLGVQSTVYQFDGLFVKYSSSRRSGGRALDHGGSNSNRSSSFNQKNVKCHYF